MIHITRRLARDLKTLFRRALGFTRYCDAPPVELSVSELATGDGILTHVHELIRAQQHLAVLLPTIQAATRRRPGS